MGAEAGGGGGGAGGEGGGGGGAGGAGAGGVGQCQPARLGSLEAPISTSAAGPSGQGWALQKCNVQQYTGEIVKSKLDTGLSCLRTQHRP